VLHYLVLLLATIGIEALVVFAAVPGPGRRRALATSACLNLLTHPLATMLLAEPRLANELFAVEALVMLVEAVGYLVVGGLGVGRAIVVSILANVVTTAAGWVYHAVA
jgi:hypothetical protein